jgi:hypothetical protein
MMQKSGWGDMMACTSVPDVTSLSILPHQNRKKAEMTQRPNTWNPVGKMMTRIRKLLQNIKLNFSNKMCFL